MTTWLNYDMVAVPKLPSAKRDWTMDYVIATQIMEWELDPIHLWWKNQHGYFVHTEQAFSPTSDLKSAIEVLNKVAFDQGHYLIENHPEGGVLVSITLNGKTGTFISHSFTDAISQAVVRSLIANQVKVA